MQPLTLGHSYLFHLVWKLEQKVFNKLSESIWGSKNALWLLMRLNLIHKILCEVLGVGQLIIHPNLRFSGLVNCNSIQVAWYGTDRGHSLLSEKLVLRRCEKRKCKIFVSRLSECLLIAHRKPNGKFIVGNFERDELWSPHKYFRQDFIARVRKLSDQRKIEILPNIDVTCFVASPKQLDRKPLLSLFICFWRLLFTGWVFTSNHIEHEMEIIAIVFFGDKPIVCVIMQRASWILAVG